MRRILCAALWLLGTPAFAVNYHIRTDGANSPTCSGLFDASSASAPNCAWLTISDAITAAVCGDIIDIHDGTHTTSVSNSLSCISTGGPFTIFGLLTGKGECTDSNRIIIRGEMTGSTHNTIIDGQNTVQGGILGCNNSGGITIKDLKFINMAGGGKANNNIGIAAIIGGDDVTIDNIFIQSSLGDIGEDGTGAISIANGTRELITNNRIEANYSTMIALTGNTATPPSDVGNSVISGNYLSRTRMRYADGTDGDEWSGIIVKRARNLSILNNYVEDLSTNYGFAEVVSGIRSRDCEGLTINGNVIVNFLYGIYFQEANTCGPIHPGVNACIEAAIMENNTIHKTIAHTSLAGNAFVGQNGMLLNCQGCTLRNNSFMADLPVDESFDSGYILGGTGANPLIPGTETTIDYNFWSNRRSPNRSTNSSYSCLASTSCAAVSAIDGHVSTNDVHNSISNGIQATGNKPDPYYAVTLTSTQRNAGDDAHCNVSPTDGECDIAAVQEGGGGVASFALNVAISGTGFGFLRDNPFVGIDCGGTFQGSHTDCTEMYTSGTLVDFTTSRDTTSTGTISLSGTGCTLFDTLMDQTRNCTVTIPLATYTMTVTKTGSGTGTVTSSPAGINCGGDCSEAYNWGTTVTLTATPTATNAFLGWSGTGCNTQGQVTIVQDGTCTATFTVTPPTSTTKPISSITVRP